MGSIFFPENISMDLVAKKEEREQGVTWKRVFLVFPSELPRVYARAYTR